MPLLRMASRGLPRQSTSLGSLRILGSNPTKGTSRSRTPRSQPVGKPSEARSDQPAGQPPEGEQYQSKVEAVSAALREGAKNADNSLLSPVHIPDDPHGIIKPDHPAMSILNNSSIVVQRQIEMLNVFLGFEQANKYVIMDGQGNHIGYLAEKELGLGGTMARQMFKTHRSFETHVFDKNEREVLRFHRPFSYINSCIRVYDPTQTTDPQLSAEDITTANNSSGTALVNQPPAPHLHYSQMRVIGEAQQQWAPLRRKYNLFLSRDVSTIEESATTTQNPNPNTNTNNNDNSNSKALQTTTDANRAMVQFAYVDEPFLSWDFSLRRSDASLLGSVNRNFGGFAREIFTDTGVYALRMDASAVEHLQQQEPPQQQQQQQQQQQTALATAPAMTLDERALMLATAVTIDFDYFSRHSSAVGGGMGLPIPIWIPGMGGGAAAEGGAVGAGGAVVGAGEIGAAEAGAGALGGAARGMGASEGAVAGVGSVAGMEAMRRGQGGGAGAGSADDASPVAGDPWGNGGGDGGAGDLARAGGDGGGEGGGWLDSLSEFFD
ncbi:uncharacterized protein K452DRAFT_335194 [Aplosporella prunicola CBS 121167]|uniref:Scramblase family protein n=1 Tax=Aplosporella prunicola CBS 121167 TaxID=1176127 RepID=A0A6A6BA57_9PEZI|nr:uncharacterized protein K452DRAFT_335194 [Aplosporella prunicola CBS 121167]KAF2140124.1 hypothetical protein K452DRAFT_335194 [Aplosporella prunicola CBS 121167]